MTIPVSRVSGSPATSAPKGDYTVKKGDTLSELATRFKVEVPDLLRANPHITNKDVIIAGHKLVIPKPEAQTAATATTPAQTGPKKPNDKYQAPVDRERTTGPIQPPQSSVSPGLDGVRKGETVLANGANSPAVREAQELLQKNGFPLKRFGADGDFGGETEVAVKKFQGQNSLPETGKIDKDTLVKLEAGAKQNVKYPEYDKLFADGVLRTTIAVGHDEKGWHRPEMKKIVDGLAAQGYESVDVSKMSDAEIKQKLGVDPSTVDKESAYFVKQFQHNGKDVTAVTRLITPDTPNAERKFADAMAKDEVVLYGGHGRYGSGPDFDDIHNPAGNYRIGDPYEAGHVTPGENDLKKTSMTKDYQLMFFHGCNTRLYLDDLRTKAKGKTTENLDVIGTNTELYWDATARDVLAMTEGLTSGKSIDELKTNLNAINKRSDEKMADKFTFDGFKDNAVQSHPQ